MDNQVKRAALFDFAGVIMDTEPSYTIFWDAQGVKYLGKENFGAQIKGMTLTQIYDKHFSGMEEAQQEIRQGLDKLEESMAYEYVPGVLPFVEELRRAGICTAVVTSSNKKKMENVYRAYPQFTSQFDRILTADLFKRSKPDPDCFLFGMEIFGTAPENTYVFEDSFHGLQAGRSSGAIVIGLATTNSREAIADKADYVMDDFREMTVAKMIRITRKA